MFTDRYTEDFMETYKLPALAFKSIWNCSAALRISVPNENKCEDLCYVISTQHKDAL